MSITNIVILGGSYAGVSAATSLASALPSSKINITLIDARSHWHLPTASIRGVVQPGFASTQWVPYTELFKTHPGSKVIQGKASSIDKDAKKVKLENGEQISFDYLIISTGTKLPGPMKTEWNNKEDGVKETDQIVEAVKTAEHVVIVGGGIIGCELAGEIATDYPTKKVTIIHNGSSLMHTTKTATDSLRTLVLKDLQSFPTPVEVLLNERVVPGKNGQLLPNGKGFNLGKHTLRTESGKEITGDVQFLSTGTQTPNSDFVKSLGKDAVDANGFVKTRPTAQLVGFDNIFAIGDVSDLDDVKLAYLAGVQATLATKNIIALINGTSKLGEYTKIPEVNSPAIVSLGRNGGRTQLPYLGVFGSFTTRNIKSANLMVPMMWGNAKASALYPKEPSKGWLW
ncbi:hypothetical protein HDU97_009922 [Phlyctochytrium planicorne]|nr:hypothetical protein HDU97_009922 [Phlyctochytrium planicorne]